MDMKKIAVLTALIAYASFNRARAATNTVLGCLQTSAQSGGLSGCLNESGRGDSSAVSADGMALAGTAPSLGIVPTPMGYTSAEEGTLKAGFYNGLDSGFKTAFMAIVYLPILGIEASGAPYQTNAGTIAFTALGVLLAIPAAIIAAVLGAPLGTAAGMIAEKASPGSTSRWFTF